MCLFRKWQASLTGWVSERWTLHSWPLNIFFCQDFTLNTKTHISNIVKKKNNNIVFCPNNWDIRFYQCETNTQSQFTEHTSMHLKQAIFSYKFEWTANQPLKCFTVIVKQKSVKVTWYEIENIWNVSLPESVKLWSTPSAVYCIN